MRAVRSRTRPEGSETMNPQEVKLSTIDGGITAARGFQVAALHSGVKTDGLDLAVIASDQTASAAGVFTTNRAVAAPVLVCQEHLERSGGIARAIVVNSGCANACTGTSGMAAARKMAAAAATAFSCPTDHTLVASTGVIGLPLPIDSVTEGIMKAATRLSRTANRAAAEAIMTTDPWPKETAVQVNTACGSFTVGGMVKGAGMIEPMMATMLGFITTDAKIDPTSLHRALKAVVDDTFNAITVDGECSTNDSVFLLASGVSGVTIDDSMFPVFVAGLRSVCGTLAREIVRGGEGATKLAVIRVTGAKSKAEAKKAARVIANSPLVKTAVHGEDPNWGRLVAAAGRSGVSFNLNRCQVRIGTAVLFADGNVFLEHEVTAAEHMRGQEVQLQIDLGTGGLAEATVWTSDFSAEYVRINAAYRT